MKNNMHTKEISILVLLGGLLYLHTGAYAHGMFAMSTGVVALVGVSVYLGLMWREFSRDEREEHTQGVAHKIAFICAVCVLTIGIIIEYVMGHTDTWLLVTLITLLAGKSIGTIYAERYL